MILNIGFDDTDSKERGCTTYIAALIIEQMRRLEVSFVDYPVLVRLNPNIPWKTRGNGAICLRIQLEDIMKEKVEELILEIIEEQSDLNNYRTDPGVVFLEGKVPKEIRVFTEKATTGIVTREKAQCLIQRFGAEAWGYNKGRGIIGALAAIGSLFKGDYTFEVLAYREPINWGTQRRVNRSSVIKMAQKLANLVFNSIDHETNRVLITPRGPDPVLYGIRGESPKSVRIAHESISCNEAIERWVIYRTNQATDAHMVREDPIGEVKPYNPVVVKGEVSRSPRIVQGGHVVFQLHDETGYIDCAAYKPTGELRNIVKYLLVGDVIRAYGGVRVSSSVNPITINLEKTQIIRLKTNWSIQNPFCPICGKRTKSLGKGQGYKCKKCGYHGRDLKKKFVKEKRQIELGIYITSPRSQRHLTKPLSRYGIEKTGTFGHFDTKIPYARFFGK